ncbi:hypothetical protein AM571_CH01769 [Rhizobium etli 8C-3]|uniref:Uncharacterized protein n=3 Tax=Rhizobium TaxID=379 RepID=A0A4R3QGJ8_9HYPH|nr:hypothetical protein AM571_CH01769 [Rhizobium etli 8C-3]TCU20858.1 hypothetical protein EV130_112238 [Rhizobium azibense]TCU35234.1 hypothetical protein EV129_110236 [Rhizobium azibense]
MRRTINMLCASAVLFLAGFAPTEAAMKVVKQKPTVSSLAPGEAVLYDDKRCPAGMIARYARAKNRDEIRRGQCVHH